MWKKENHEETEVFKANISWNDIFKWNMPFKDRKRKELRKVGENAWQGKISFGKLPRRAS